MTLKDYHEAKAEWMGLVDKYAEEARQYMLLCNEVIYHAASREYKAQGVCQNELKELKARFDALTQKSFTPLTPKSEAAETETTVLTEIGEISVPGTAGMRTRNGWNEAQRAVFEAQRKKEIVLS